MTTKRKSRKSGTRTASITDIRSRVDRIRHDVEEAVDTLRKRAVGVLPAPQRRQVDEVFDRLTSVSHDVNKAVGHWRADLEKRFRVIRGTVDKRVSTLRKRTETQRRTLVGGFEGDVRKVVGGIFRRLQLPVNGDIEAIKRRLSLIERRLGALEKGERRAA
jgi:hypothetical protein